MDLKITVITVCYNAEKNIEKTADSVMGQTYGDIEYIIVDGASTDGTPEKLGKYSGRENVLIYSERDSGIYNAMNRGIARASGDYIIFLNAGDTFYDSHVLENAAGAMSADRKAIYYGSVVLTGKGSAGRISGWGKTGEKTGDKIMEGRMPCHQSVFAPAYSLKSHYFNEKYRLRADFEWVAYSAARDIDFVPLDMVVSNYDMNGMSADAKHLSDMNSETGDIIGQYAAMLKKEGGLAEFNARQINRLRDTLGKVECLFGLMVQWMGLVQGGMKMETYFAERGFTRVAVYGMGPVGECFIRGMEGTGVSVEYAIDRDADKIRAAVPVVPPEGRLEEVDAVVVTAITYISEIREALRGKMGCSIISIKEILDEIAARDKGRGGMADAGSVSDNTSI